MRATWLTSVIVLALFTTSCNAQRQGLERKGRASERSVAANRNEKPQSIQADGFGESYEDAFQDGLKRARTKVEEFFEERGAALRFTPALETIQKMVRGQEEAATREMEGIGSVRHVVLHLELGRKEVNDLLRQDRHVRADDRMRGLAKVLAGLVVFLGAISGYCRLEEATKGYYTTFLRLATLAFIAAVGAGIWCLA